MKKIKLAFTVITVIFMSLIMAVTASAADAPDRETAEDIFFDMGFSTWGNGYFGCHVTQPEGENAPDEVVFQYMYLSDALDDYYDEEIGYYTIAYDEYISLVDKTFVNHSDMKAYLADYIDPETNVISWFRGGFGGPQTWVATEYCVKGDTCFVTGVFVDMDIEAYPDFAGMIVDEDYIYVDEYPAVILDEIILTIQNTEDGWKILEYRDCGYHIVDDFLYSFDEMYFRFTVEDNVNVEIIDCEDNEEFFTGFYGNDSLWHYGLTKHSYEIKADENYVIESVVLTDANGETVLTPDENGVYTFEVVEIGTLKVTTRGIPAIKEYEGGLAYYIGNDIATDYTGLVEYENVFYYVENGIVTQDYTGLVYYNDIWYYVESGIINWDYTGLAYHYGDYYYVENGVLNWDYTGLTNYYNTWYYVENGILNWGYTGLTNYYNTWYYVENGILNWGYTGLTNYYNTWYYVENGILNWNYTGLTNYYNTWYYVENGILNWNYTGLTNYYDTWYYVSGGILDWGYTGLAYHYGTWYYVNNGVLDWGYTGLAYHYGTWYYVNNGVLDWSYTGLVYHYGTWYYVSGGTHISYTGFCEYYGVWYFIRNGSIQWDYTGTYSYYGTSYYVNNGVVDFSFTGVCFGGMEGAVYVVNGVVDRGFTGLCENNGSWYHVENGRLTNQSLLFEQDGVVYYVDHGIVNFYFTGFVEVDYYWLYIEDGIWDYTFTGKVDLEDGTFAYIEEGVVVDIR